MQAALKCNQCQETLDTLKEAVVTKGCKKSVPEIESACQVGGAGSAQCKETIVSKCKQFKKYAKSDKYSSLQVC